MSSIASVAGSIDAVTPLPGVAHPGAARSGCPRVPASFITLMLSADVVALSAFAGSRPGRRTTSRGLHGEGATWSSPGGQGLRRRTGTETGCSAGPLGAKRAPPPATQDRCEHGRAAARLRVSSGGRTGRLAPPACPGLEPRGRWPAPRGRDEHDRSLLHAGDRALASHPDEGHLAGRARAGRARAHRAGEPGRQRLLHDGGG
jgi:hypothetical protein